MAEAMKIQKIDITLDGLSDIMFDKFYDHSKTIRPPEQKLYLAEGNQVVLPSENLNSFLFGKSLAAGCAKTFEDKKNYMEFIRIGMGHIVIKPALIPFINKNQKPIKFKDFDEGGLFYIDESSPVAKNTKRERIQRPVLRLPWALSFQLLLVENNVIDEQRLYNWFMRGGIEIALGTYRPRYGRFLIDKWNIK